MVEQRQLEFGGGWKMPERPQGQFRRRRNSAAVKPVRISANDDDGQLFFESKGQSSTTIHILFSLVLLAASIWLAVGFQKGIDCFSHIAAILPWQFSWGLFGGCIMVGYRVYAFAIKLTDDSPWPRLTFKKCLLLGWWVGFPIVSGFLSMVCDPHSPLMAVFEGASAPALFLLLAKDFRV